MRNFQQSWVAGLVLLLVTCAGAALGQQTQSQTVPDSPQPTAAQAAPAAVPELKLPTGADAVPAGQPVGVAKPKADQDFPFPEDSNAPVTVPSAAETPKPEPARPAEPAVPPGFSSSVALKDEGSEGTSHAPDEARVKKDKQVASFYWNQGNYEGSYLRYKDAVDYAPQDPETWFGLAESERMLGRFVKAKQDYQHCLQLAPKGSRAKQAEKEIARMPATDKVEPERPGPRVP